MALPPVSKATTILGLGIQASGDPPTGLLGGCTFINKASHEEHFLQWPSEQRGTSREDGQAHLVCPQRTPGVAAGLTSGPRTLPSCLQSLGITAILQGARLTAVSYLVPAPKPGPRAVDGGTQSVSHANAQHPFFPSYPHARRPLHHLTSRFPSPLPSSFFSRRTSASPVAKRKATPHTRISEPTYSHAPLTSSSQNHT